MSHMTSTEFRASVRKARTILAFVQITDDDGIYIKIGKGELAARAAGVTVEIRAAWQDDTETVLVIN